MKLEASRKIKIGVLMAALIFAGFLISFISKGRKSSGPHLSLAFVGFTKDAAGVRSSCFSITNLDSTPVVVLPPFIITNETGGSVAGYPVSPTTLGTCLNLGEFQTITFPTPTNQIPWKLRVPYFQDPALRRGFRGISEIFIALMHGGRVVTKQYEISTDWIGGGNGTNPVANSAAAP